MTHTVSKSVLAMAVIYFLIGVIFLSLYKTDSGVPGNILLAVPGSSVANIVISCLMVVTCIGSFPLYLSPMDEVIEGQFGPLTAGRFFITNKKAVAFRVAMVVLKSGQMDNGTMSKMYFNMTDTIFDVNNTINKYVTDNREVPEKNGTEKMIKILLGAPGVLRVGVGLFKFMDKHGLLPKKVIDMSPFHNSLCISNLASIRTNHIYHHCYEFGTTSVFITMGNLREVPRRSGGEIIFERCIPLGVVMDERICSGSYFALAFRKIRKYLRNPELLELPPEVVNEDPDK